MPPSHTMCLSLFCVRKGYRLLFSPILQHMADTQLLANASQQLRVWQLVPRFLHEEDHLCELNTYLWIYFQSLHQDY